MEPAFDYKRTIMSHVYPIYYKTVDVFSVARHSLVLPFLSVICRAIIFDRH